jgi:hypothetical protein
MINRDRDLVLNRFKKMDEFIQNLEEIKQESKKEFLSNFLL